MVLCRQRMVEYALSRQRSCCRWLLYFWDVLYCAVLPTAGLTCLILYHLGRSDIGGLETVRYQLEWAWFTIFGLYYCILGYVFCFHNVLEELHEYCHTARHC